jgi:exodeoxyribonuclease VII large subunit
MLKIIEKRWPLLEVVIVDTLVQGDAAASQIARSLRYADTLQADVVVVGRGGGSTEDLWAFNEEVVANALFEMHTPVVSAVGHEVDVLISDFVADLRAPTPSAAIEMILPDVQEILYTLDELMHRFKQSMAQNMQKMIQKSSHLEELLLRSSPLRRLNESELEFNRLKEEFDRVVGYKVSNASAQLPNIEKSFEQNIHFILQQKEQHIAYITQKLVMNDPAKKHKKGWAQVVQQGKIVDLNELEEKETFILENTDIKIEALCLKKTAYQT